MKSANTRPPRRRKPQPAAVIFLLSLGFALLVPAVSGCGAKEKVVVAGSGDDDSDPQYQQHKKMIEERIKQVDQNPRLTPEQKAQVKHDLMADGLAGHTKKEN